jgi:hypothetical protein
MNNINPYLYSDMAFNPRWLAHAIRCFYPLTRLRFIWTRWEFPYILNVLGLTGEGLEVGVLYGNYSAYILRAWKGKKLHSVDPWRHFAEGDYVDMNNHSDDTFEEIYQRAVQQLAPFGGRSNIVRGASPEVAGQFRDGQFDFVYIDAQHQYAGAKTDIEAWWPKVRSGGILAGHDYLDGNFPEGNFGVKTAVDEFAGQRGLRVLASHEPKYISFFLVHP